MSNYSSALLLFILVFLVSCSENSRKSVSITDLYPLQDGNTWDYYLIENSSDTTNFFVDFETSQLSDNSETTILELISLEMSINIVLSGKTTGICINFVDGNANQVDVNTLSVKCGGLLKYPISTADSYTYSYSTDNRSYSYNVSVTEETVVTDAGTYNTLKYSIPSGARPERDVTEAYFNPEIGLVKLNLEYEKGTRPSRVLILKSTSI